MNEVTEQIAKTLRWMKTDMDFRRMQTGLDGEPLSPEMELAGRLLDDLEAGRIECRRIGTEVGTIPTNDATNRPMTYLACPYSHPDVAVREGRFHAANRASARLMAQGVILFSPISHTHPIATDGGLPKDWQFWERYDRAVLACCHKIIVLRLPGWEESCGVQAEMGISREMGIPGEFMEPV